MKQITCPHCGDTYPDFDVAHVCSKGPYAPKLKPKINEQLIGDLFAEATRRMTGSSSKEFAEKFAELIVSECVGIVENQGKFSRYDTLAKKIKKHFGVEQ